MRMKKKNNIYIQNITRDKALLCTRHLEHFVSPSGRARATCCSSPTCYTHTYSSWLRNRRQVTLGRATATQQRQKGARVADNQIAVSSHHLRCAISIAIHKIPTASTCRYVSSWDMGRTNWTFTLRSPAQGMQVLKTLHSNVIKIKGLAGLLFLRLGQTRASHKYRKLQICKYTLQRIKTFTQHLLAGGFNSVNKILG